MTEIQLGVIESRFADMIWAHEPITSHELVKMTAEEFGWARTTTHNVIRKLCAKGVFVNNNGVVTSLIPREQFYSLQSKQFVEETFQGSLPAFLASFSAGKRLSDEEVEELQRMIDIYREKKDE